MIMVMKPRLIPAGRFKAECLGLLDEVAQTGADLIITKRGKPVARVTPVEAPPSLRGSIRFNISDEELIAPLDEAWDSDVA